MIKRHPILDAVVIALVLLGIAVVIGVTTGDDSNDAAVADELSADPFHGNRRLAAASGLDATVHFENASRQGRSFHIRVSTPDHPCDVSPEDVDLPAGGTVHFVPFGSACETATFRAVVGNRDLIVLWRVRGAVSVQCHPVTPAVRCVVDDPNATVTLG